MRVANASVVFVAALLLSACVHNLNEQISTPASLFGDEWLVEDIAGRGVIDYARTTMTFGTDGQVSGETSCNRYFAGFKVKGTQLQIGEVGVTKRACVPAVMDQEMRFLNAINAVSSYHIDSAGMLVLSTGSGVSIKASRTMGTKFNCTDGSVVEAWYPTPKTARIRLHGEIISMNSVVSASGTRYVGGGWQWWTKGMLQGWLARLGESENIASAGGLACTAP